VAQPEIVHAFLEGTTYWDLVRELGQQPASRLERAVRHRHQLRLWRGGSGGHLRREEGKRVDDAPAEGSKSKEPQQKHKRGKKGKKPRHEAHVSGRDDDGDEVLAVDPA
jgi:hypothetical protein